MRSPIPGVSRGRADALNLSQSAVSCQISALEASLKTPLFHRHARGLLLTEQGELLYQTVHDVFHMLTMAEAQLSERQERPSGPLKITATVALGSPRGSHRASRNSSSSTRISK
jgi:DNA-binding transcriptional LysR family regulator